MLAEVLTPQEERVLKQAAEEAREESHIKRARVKRLCTICYQLNRKKFKNRID